MGLFTPDARHDHSRHEKARIFFFSPRRSVIKWATQLDLRLDHVPGAAAVAKKRVRMVTLFRKTEEEHPEREERMDAEFLLSLVSGNRFILTLFIQNIISINSSLNYVI